MFPSYIGLDSSGARCLRLRVALFVFTLGVAPFALADWVKTYEWSAQVGLGGIVPSPSDPQRVYAFRGDARWFLLSIDGGATWHRTPDLGQYSYVADMTVDPFDVDTIYVIVSSAIAPGLYKSTDAGVTFERLGKDVFVDSGAHVAIDPHDRNILYAPRPVVCAPSCSQGGVIKSVDGGFTWSDTARTDSANGPIAIDPNNPLILYTAGYDLPESKRTGGLYRTTDGGLTWPSMFPGYTSIRFVTTDTRSRVYAIVDVMFEKLLLRSSNHGELWTRLSVNVPPPDPSSLGEGPWPNLTAVATDPRRSETLYVSSYTHGVLASYDDGVTWQPLGELPDRFVNTLAVTSEGVVLAVTRSGIYRWEPPPPRRRAAKR
jgi:photosystem II stability/assembly factor-like uncharacterized protein